MPSDSFTAGPPQPGLPPVAPPSGKFIVQLFLVPGLIVGLVVCVLLLFSWLFGGTRSPAAYLQRLDDPNTDIRWRAAADLADVLTRDEHLASDGAFALELARRAENARDASASAERALADRWGSLKPEEVRAERLKETPERDYLRYLCACLGGFRVPAGVPVLRGLAEQDAGMEPWALAARRRDAVWALASLGRNLRRFDEAKAPDQDAILAGLDRAADDPARGDDARRLARQLRDRRDGRPGALGVDRTLAKCAGAADPFLRELSALALTFWDGSDAENRRTEQTLERLAHDDGRGADLREADPKAPAGGPASVTKSPGLHVRFNATAALAARGSPKTRLDQLGEMLDADRLRELCLVRDTDGVERPDELFIVQTQVAALEAVAKLHRKLPSLDLSKLRPAVDRLAGDANRDLRAQARKTQGALAE